MSEYDFFLNPETPQKTGRQSFGGGGQTSLARRLMIVVGGIFFVIIILWLVFGVLLKPDTSKVDAYADLSLEQLDIISLSNEATRQIKSSDSIELSSGARILITSDKAKIDAILAELGRELSEDELLTFADADIRASLEAAASANRYDSAFLELYTEKLLAYRAQLAEIYADSSNDAHREVLNQAYANVSILLGLDVATDQ